MGILDNPLFREDSDTKTALGVSLADTNKRWAAFESKLKKKIQLTQQKAIDNGLNKGESWEQISANTGVPLSQIKSYSEKTRPGYGSSPSPVKNIAGKVGGFLDSAFVKPVEKSINTVGAGVTGLVGLGEAGYESLVGSDQDYQNKLNETQQAINNVLTHGVGNAGAFMTPEQAQNASLFGNAQQRKDFLGPVAEGVAEVGPLAVPAGGILKGASLGTKMLVTSLANAGVGAGSTAASEFANGQKLNLGDIGKSAAVGGILGAAIPAAGRLLKGGGRTVDETLARRANAKAVAKLDEFNAPIDEGAANAASKLDAEDAFAATRPQSTKLLPDGSERLSARVEEIDNELGKLQRGEVEPALKTTNQEDLVALKQEALKYKSADEFNNLAVTHDLLHKSKLEKAGLSQNEYASIHRSLDDVKNNYYKYSDEANAALKDAVEKSGGKPLTPSVRKRLTALNNKAKAMLDEEGKIFDRIKSIDGDGEPRQQLTDLYNQAHAEAKYASNSKVGTFANDSAQTLETTKPTIENFKALVKERKELIAKINAIKDPDKKLAEQINATSSTLKMAQATGNDEAAKSAQAKLTNLATEAQNRVQKEVVQTGKSIATQAPEMNKFKRIFVSTNGELSNMGRAGKKIAELNDNVEARAETLVGRWGLEAPTIFKKASKGGLTKKEFTKFVDALDQLRAGKSPNVTPKIRQAINEWVELSPKVRQTAIESGLDVGDLGPYYFPKNYSQLARKGGYDTAAKHLVKSGQAENIGQAYEILDYVKDSMNARKFGHLEAERKIDLPEFDKTKGALAHYLYGTAERIGHAENFGVNNEVAKDLISQISKDGYKGSRAKHLFEVATGEADYNPGAAKLSSGIRQFNTFRLLRKAALSNVGQNVNTATVTGYLNTVKGGLKLLKPDVQRKVMESGVVSEAVLKDMIDQYGITGLAGRVGSPMFASIETFNRKLAASAGMQWAERLALKGGDKSVNQLRKLGVKGEIGPKLTNEQLVQAARGAVKRTQFKVGAKDLPAWTNSPLGKLAIQFRTFSYKQSSFMYNEILKPASEGNILPLIRFTAALPIGFAVSEGRNFLSKAEGSKSQGPQKPAQNVLDAFESLGGLGLANDVTFAAGQYQKPGSGFAESLAGTVGGPTASYTVGALDDITEAKQGNPTSLERRGVQSTLGPLGSLAANKFFPYPSSKLDLPFNDDKAAQQYEQTIKDAGYTPRKPAAKQLGKKLTGKQYDEYTKLYSAYWLNAYNRVIDTGSFQAASPKTKADILKGITKHAGEKARMNMFGRSHK